MSDIINLGNYVIVYYDDYKLLINKNNLNKNINYINVFLLGGKTNNLVIKSTYFILRRYPQNSSI